MGPEDIRVGTGGWSENRPPYDNPKHYSRIFDFVELSSTFYSTPTRVRLRAQRSLAPDSFAFTVKSSRVVTHSLTHS